MNISLLAPPIAFIIMLAAVLTLTALLSKISFNPKHRGADESKAYACGEDMDTHLMQPDYGQFFPFAFFFTILHVVTLMLATVPVSTLKSLLIPVIYLVGLVVAMLILFRR